MSKNVVRSMVLLAAATLALGLATAVFGAKPHVPVSLEQARAAALKVVPEGTIKSEELEKEHGKWIYSFDIQSGKELREVWVDAHTGEILQNKVESPAKEKAEAANEHD
jgi:uncharacterized membrane protein YkoI